MEESTLYRYQYHNIDVTFGCQPPEEVIKYLEDWGNAGFTLFKAILFCYKAELEGREKKEWVLYPSPAILDFIRYNTVHCKP